MILGGRSVCRIPLDLEVLFLRFEALFPSRRLAVVLVNAIG